MVKKSLFCTLNFATKRNKNKFCLKYLTTWKLTSCLIMRFYQGLMDVLLSKVFLNFSLLGLTKDFQVSCPLLKKIVFHYFSVLIATNESHDVNFCPLKEVFLSFCPIF